MLIAFAASPALALDLRNADAKAGFVSLGWTDRPAGRVELQINDGTGWQTLYEGTDQASTLSGLEDGTYQFRLTDETGEAGEVVSFTVAHHPLTLALQFFGAGLVLFIILLVVLIRPATTETMPKRGAS